MSLLHFLNTFGSSGWESMSPQMRGNGFSTWRGGYAKQGWGVGGAGPGDDETGPGDFGAGGIAGAEEWGTARTGMTGYGMGLGYGKLAEGGLRGTKRSRGRGKEPEARWKYNPRAEQARLEAWINRTLGEGEGRDATQRKLGEEARDRDIDFQSQKALEQQLEANRQAMKAMDEWDRKQAIAIESTRRFNDELQSLATGGLKSAYAGLLDLADAAVQGQDGIGKMALNMLKAITMGLSQQLFAMGLAASIEAAGYTAGVVTAPMAIPASAKAAIFFAGATTLAGLGLGLSAASAGMSGGRGGGGGGGSSSGANYRPSFGTKTSSKDLPPIVVRVTFDRSDPAAEAFARRKVKADLVAAGYQDGV
jgi:hypothetical protein